jgi:hypothetical protein
MDTIPALALSRPDSDTSSADAVTTLFAHGCRLLAATPPEFVRATSVTCSISSPADGESLATAARQVAAEYHLAAAIEIDGNHLRATFVRQETGPPASNDEE